MRGIQELSFRFQEFSPIGHGMGHKTYHVYILTNSRNGTLYIGVTSNLAKRVFQHRQADPSTFTGKYGLTKLVYVQTFSEVIEAITYEKQLKRFKRFKKIELIEGQNPSWRNLTTELG